MERHRNQASFPSPTLRSIEDPNEGWQVVRPCRVRCFVASVAPKPRYLAATVGRCLNCLSSSCRRADCRLPTRCFNCHGFQHHLRDLMLPRNSPAALGGGALRLRMTPSRPLVIKTPQVHWSHHSLMLVASSSLTISFSCLQCTPSHAHVIPWLKRRHWEHRLVHHVVVAMRK
jgi:hypothetical protein